jgi:hypothetical protein
MLIGEYKNSNNYIPVKIKENVWIASCYGGEYNYLTPCFTCEKILRPPELIKKRLFKNIRFKKMNIFPKAVFRSVIQNTPNFLNFNPENNLVLVCQDCNFKLGSKNINIETDRADVIMISDDLFNKKCNHFIKSQNRYCKNVSIYGNYCTSHIHLH